MWLRFNAFPRPRANDVNDFVVSFALVSERLIRAFLAEGARRTEARFSGAAPGDVVLVSGGLVCKGHCRRGFTRAGLYEKALSSHGGSPPSRLSGSSWGWAPWPQPARAPPKPNLRSMPTSTY